MPAGVGLWIAVQKEQGWPGSTVDDVQGDAVALNRRTPEPVEHVDFMVNRRLGRLARQHPSAKGLMSGLRDCERSKRSGEGQHLEAGAQRMLRAQARAVGKGGSTRAPCPPGCRHHQSGLGSGVGLGAGSRG
jgi:hypothetical protein